MKDSNIEWTDHTFNPWIGCTKVSPGCLNCYAETLMDTRYKRVKWGKGNPRQRTSKSYWSKPLQWNREASFAGKTLNAAEILAWSPPRVFCASLADWLDDEVPIEWLADLLKLIHDTPYLDWLLLTKRPENWYGRLSKALIVAQGGDPDDKDYFVKRGECFPEGEFANWLNDWTGGDAPENIWLGTSVEDQKRADERIPELLKIPAVVRFLSCEPLLSQVDLYNYLWTIPNARLNAIHWCIVGGESGPGKRPMNLEWARSLRDQCKAASIAYFFKQIDKVQPIPDDLMIRQFPTPTPGVKR